MLYDFKRKGFRTMNDKKVIELPASTNFNPEQALHSMFSHDCSDVICIGYSNGELVVRSSRMTRAEALFLLEQAKQWALLGGT